MAERQQALAAVILAGSGGREPVVVHRRRRHQRDAQQRPHADQPEAARRAARPAPPTSSAVCRRKLAGVEGIALYMQPVQDLTIEDRVSRTQYQFTVEDANPDELSVWVPQLVDGCASMPQLADVASDLQDGGLQAYVDIDRATASRLGITPGGDRQRALQRLRPAAGVDDLHADQPVPRRARGEARVPARAGRARADLCAGRQCPSAPATVGANASAALARPAQARRPQPRAAVAATGAADVDRAHQRARDAAGRSTTSASFRRRRSRSTSRPARRSATRSTAIESGAAASSACRPACRSASRARRSRSARSLANELWLILAAIVTMYIVLGVLYESYIHPITILSTLPSAGVGALLGADALRQGPRRSSPSSASSC